MASVTLNISEELKKEINHFSWVNWSETARIELLKKDIFERYVKTGEVTDDDWKFCDEIDWHPVDELPMREEFVKELQRAKKERPIKIKSVKEIFE